MKKYIISLIISIVSTYNLGAFIYTEGEYSKDISLQINQDGMRHVTLSKDKSFKEQLTSPNTIYDIKYNFDLGNNTKPVEIPNNCTLNFMGGRISNGAIKGSNTHINESFYCFSNITFSGSFSNNHLSISSWGAEAALSNSDISRICDSKINDAVNSGYPTIQIPSGMWLIGKPISITKNDFSLIGVDMNSSKLQIVYGVNMNAIEIGEHAQGLLISNLAICGRYQSGYSYVNGGIYGHQKESVDSRMRIMNISLSYMGGRALDLATIAAYIQNIQIFNCQNGVLISGTDHHVQNLHAYVCGKKGIVLHTRNSNYDDISAKICGNITGESSIEVDGSLNRLSNYVIQQSDGNGLKIKGNSNICLNGAIDAIGRNNNSTPLVLEESISNNISFFVENNTLDQHFDNIVNLDDKCINNIINISESRYNEAASSNGYLSNYTANFTNDISINGVKLSPVPALLSIPDGGNVKLGGTSNSSESIKGNTLHLYHRGRSSYNQNNILRKEIPISYVPNGKIYVRAIASSDSNLGEIGIGFKVISNNKELIIHNTSYKDSENGYSYDYYKKTGDKGKFIVDFVDLSKYNNVSGVYLIVETHSRGAAKINFDATLSNIEICTSEDRQIPYIQLPFGKATERPEYNRQTGMMFFDTTLGKPIFWNGEKWVDSNGTVIQ